MRDNQDLGIQVWQLNKDNGELSQTVADYELLLKATTKELKDYKRKDQIWRLFYGEKNWEYLLKLVEENKLKVPEK